MAEKMRPHDALNIVERDRWQCFDCDLPTETPTSRYCIHCRLYREDVNAGVFDDDWHEAGRRAITEKANDER